MCRNVADSRNVAAYVIRGTRYTTAGFTLLTSIRIRRCTRMHLSWMYPPPTLANNLDSSQLNAVVDGTNVTLTWNVPNDGGAQLQEYIKSSSSDARNAMLTCSKSLSCSMTTSTGTGNTVTAQITGLATSQSHGFQVLAKNNVGASVSNNVWIVTTATETPVAPDPPRNLAAMIGDSKVTLTWDAPSNNGGSPIIFYEISARMGTTNPFFIVGTASSSATSAIVNTINGTPYQFVVYAHNNVGASTASNIINITPVAPDPPRNLAAMIGDSKVTLTWDAPSNNGDSPIIFYTIAARIGTTNPFFIVGTASSSATSAIVNTINGMPYQFVAHAHNNVGVSTASNIINTISRS